jgi:hypothetical protein
LSTAERARNVKSRCGETKREFAIFLFYLKLSAAEGTVGRHHLVGFIQDGHMLPIKKEPDNVNKQNKAPDYHHQAKPAIGTDQRLSEAWYQEVGNDENDEQRKSQKKEFGLFIRRLDIRPNTTEFCHKSLFQKLSKNILDFQWKMQFCQNVGHFLLYFLQSNFIHKSPYYNNAILGGRDYAITKLS